MLFYMGNLNKTIGLLGIKGFMEIEDSIVNQKQVPAGARNIKFH